MSGTGAADAPSSPGVTDRRRPDPLELLDRFLGPAIVLVVVILMTWLAIPDILRGPDSADDAYFAEFAKTLALGRGYGLPLGSDRIDAFAPGSGSGPGLMVPLAIAIRVVGAFDTLPGGLTFIVFLLQLGLAGLVLARRFGWQAGCGFLAAMLVALMVFGRDYQIWDTFLGEAWTLGWLIVGAAILATATRNADIILGGIALSLAYLTKQVGMFGGGAIAVAWLALLAGSGVGRRRWVRSAGLLAASGLALPIAFELVKLLALGPAGYVDLKRAEVQEAGLPGGHASTDIIATVRTLLDDSYQGWVTLAGLALISIGLVLVARRGAGTPEQRRRVARGTWLWVLLWAGSAGQLVHVAWSRSEWTRYLWLSAMLAVVACVAPMVMLTSRVRGTVLALLVGVVALTVVTRPPSADPFAPPPGHVDRSAIVAWLDARPGMPYVGMGWTQVNDIAFARTDEGTWSARDPRAWAPAPFAMVINEDFVLPTERASALYTTTTRTCEPQLTDQLTTRRLLACGDAFWQSYLGDAAVLGPEGGLLDPLTSAEEYQVGPDVSVSTTPDAPPGQAGPSVRLTATGVPSTAFRTATRNVTMDLSAVPDDAELRFWARASTKDHLGAAYLLLLSPDGYAPMGAIPTAAGQWEEHRIRKGDVGVSPGFDWSKVTNIVLRVDGGDAPYDGALDWWGLRIGG